MDRTVTPLLKGLWLTLRMFFSPRVTILYPEQKRPISPRWRGLHYFDKDAKGDTTCIACGLCVAVCPSHCITLTIKEREDGSRYPGRYELDALRCIYCGFCQEACPVNAIRLGQEYEYVGYAREDLFLTKEKLLSFNKG